LNEAVEVAEPRDKRLLSDRYAIAEGEK